MSVYEVSRARDQVSTGLVAFVFLVSSFMAAIMPLFLSARAGAVGAPGSVVLNEFSSNSSPEWVELFNTTGSSIDLTGWYVKDDTAAKKPLSGTIAAGGFTTLDLGSSYLNNGGDTIGVYDEADQVIDINNYGTAAIPAPAAGQSTARTTDGGSTWAATATPTKGNTNASAPVVTNPILSTTYPATATVGVTENFTTSINKNGAPDQNVRVKVTLANPAQAASTTLEYEVSPGTYAPLTFSGGVAYFGASAGFPLGSNTTNMRVTFSTPGSYSSTTEIVKAADGSTLGTPLTKTIVVSSPAGPVMNTTTGESFTTINAAVQDSDTTSGHVIQVRQSLMVTEGTVVSKPVTIRGDSGVVVSTSGTNQLFTITANGASIENLAFVKTENTSNQVFIGVQSDNVTIKNNRFSGQFVIPTTGATSRGLVISGGADNVVIDGNIFENLRQPAYIDNVATGIISNNHVTGTRGWVVEKATDFDFIGNTWGNNQDNTKRLDIAIIPGVSPETTSNNYTCQLKAIAAANNGAVIEDQHPAALTTCPNTAPSVTFVDPTPAENTYVRGNSITGKVTATDDHGMGSYYVRVWKNAFESGSANLVKNCQSAPGAFLLGVTQTVGCEYAPTNLTDGKYVLSAQFLDGHGAWGQSLRTFYVDNTKPTVTIKTGTGVNDGTLGTDPYGRISFKLHDGLSGLKEVVVNGHIYARTGTYNDLNWVNITKSQLISGQNSIYAVDRAGNQSTPLTFTLDLTGPTVTVKEAPNTIGGSGVYSKVSYKLFDTNKIDKVVINGVTKDLTNNQWSDVNDIRPGIFGATEGVNTMVVFDAFGNTSTVQFTIDTAGPTVAITAPANGTTFGGTNNLVTVTGTVSDAHIKDYRVTVTTGTSVVTDSGRVATSGNVNFPFSTSGLESGSYTITLEARDHADNSATSQVVITVDNDGPALSIESISGTVRGGTVTPEVTADSSAVEYEWTLADEDDDYLDIISNPTVAEPVFSPTTAGTYKFKLIASDKFGNETTKPFEFTWAPVLSANTGSGNSGVTPFTVTTPSQPEGLVATRFNTTNPQTLGITSENTAGESDDEGKVKNAATSTPNEKEVITQTSSNSGWWLLLIIAVLVAAYYGYRNWRLTQAANNK